MIPSDTVKAYALKAFLSVPWQGTLDPVYKVHGVFSIRNLPFTSGEGVYRVNNNSQQV